jgi:chromosome segregation ATPase
MSSDLGRGLFGYRRSSVNQAIADRDVMLRQAAGRAHTAEARAKELEELMARMQEQIAGQHQQLSEQLRLMSEQLSARDREIAALRAQVEELPGRPEPHTRSDSDPPSIAGVGEEVTRVLRSAEESAELIIERARATAGRQTIESERQWRDLQASLARFATWREEVERLVDDLKARIADVRQQIADIPDRVRNAFAPLADSAAAADASLADLTADLNLPLLPLPAAPAQDQADGSGFDEPAEGAEQEHAEFDPFGQTGSSGG